MKKTKKYNKKISKKNKTNRKLKGGTKKKYKKKILSLKGGSGRKGSGKGSRKGSGSGSTFAKKLRKLSKNRGRASSYKLGAKAAQVYQTLKGRLKKGSLKKVATATPFFSQNSTLPSRRYTFQSTNLNIEECDDAFLKNFMKEYASEAMRVKSYFIPRFLENEIYHYLSLNLNEFFNTLKKNGIKVNESNQITIEEKKKSHVDMYIFIQLLKELSEPKQETAELKNIYLFAKRVLGEIPEIPEISEDEKKGILNKILLPIIFGKIAKNLIRDDSFFIGDLIPNYEEEEQKKKILKENITGIPDIGDDFFLKLIVIIKKMIIDNDPIDNFIFEILKKCLFDNFFISHQLQTFICQLTDNIDELKKEYSNFFLKKKFSFFFSSYCIFLKSEESNDFKVIQKASSKYLFFEYFDKLTIYKKYSSKGYNQGLTSYLNYNYTHVSTKRDIFNEHLRKCELNFYELLKKIILMTSSNNLLFKSYEEKYNLKSLKIYLLEYENKNKNGTAISYKFKLTYDDNQTPKIYNYDIDNITNFVFDNFKSAPEVVINHIIHDIFRTHNFSLGTFIKKYFKYIANIFTINIKKVKTKLLMLDKRKVSELKELKFSLDVLLVIFYHSEFKYENKINRVSSSNYFSNIYIRENTYEVATSHSGIDNNFGSYAELELSSPGPNNNQTVPSTEVGVDYANVVGASVVGASVVGDTNLAGDPDLADHDLTEGAYSNPHDLFEIHTEVIMGNIKFILEKSSGILSIINTPGQRANNITVENPFPNDLIFEDKFGVKFDKIKIINLNLKYNSINDNINLTIYNTFLNNFINLEKIDFIKIFENFNLEVVVPNDLKKLILVFQHKITSSNERSFLAILAHFIKLEIQPNMKLLIKLNEKRLEAELIEYINSPLSEIDTTKPLLSFLTNKSTLSKSLKIVEKNPNEKFSNILDKLKLMQLEANLIEYLKKPNNKLNELNSKDSELSKNIKKFDKYHPTMHVFGKNDLLTKYPEYELIDLQSIYNRHNLSDLLDIDHYNSKNLIEFMELDSDLKKSLGDYFIQTDKKKKFITILDELIEKEIEKSPIKIELSSVNETYEVGSKRIADYIWENFKFKVIFI